MGIVGKLKFGVVSFAVIGVVIWLGVPSLRFTRERSRDDTVYTMDVSYESKRPDLEVFASLFIDNVHIRTDHVMLNAWSINYRGSRFDIVRLAVTQSHDGVLRCSILRSSDMAVFSGKITRRDQICEVQTK